MIRLASDFLARRQIRYLLCGALTAAFNLAVLALAIEGLGIETALGRSIANFAAIEISVIFSFFIYRAWVWNDPRARGRKSLFEQIMLYHFATGFIIALRGFVVFPALDWLGVQYGANTLVGIALGAFLNYFLSDRIIFK